MTPFARVVSNLFSAAHGLNHFKSFKHYYFHNCVYEVLFEDIHMESTESLSQILRDADKNTHVIFVGDAYMHPVELLEPYGSVDYSHRNEEAGLVWLRRIRDKFPHSVWLNPLRPTLWGAPTISLVRSTFPMFPLTIDGLEEAVDALQVGRAIA